MAATTGVPVWRRLVNGLLADVNIQGHLEYIRHLLTKIRLMPLLDEMGLRLAKFPDLNLPQRLDDRSVWNFCQQQGWVRFTENRNHDRQDSLFATLEDSWKIGCLPVVTLANKGRFAKGGDYADLVADEVAGILVDVADGKCRDQPRIF